MTSIGLFGGNGRMGRAVSKVIASRGDLQLAEATPDVFIDFSSPTVLHDNLMTASRLGRPIVVRR